MKNKTEDWKKISEKISKTTDKIGTPIEDGILQTVIALNVLGYKTIMSCEGHLGKSGRLLKKGLPFPWVTVEYTKNETDLSELTKNRRKLLQRKFLKQCQPVMIGIATLIDEFYKGRKKSPLYKLIVIPHHQGELRIQSLAGYFIQSQSKRERLKSYKMACIEMKMFTAFLKETFFSK